MSLSFSNSGAEATQFKRSLRRLEQDVLRMGTLVENSFRLSHEALFHRNLSVIKEISDLDDQVDQYYRQIEIKCANLITKQGAAAQDLRLLSAFMQLVRDIERIGDYAEDLAEIAVKLFPYPVPSYMAEVEEMSHNAQAMLAKSLVALGDLDATTGSEIKNLDDAVDDAHDRLYQILAFQRDVPGVVEPILLLALVIRHLERMADHATNIGQRVLYIVTGHRD
jgi:phosphate transport system protein